ncbi:hypothetical protein [Bradyrhizobium sp. CCBAU 45384]|uniref:hypothetical protein n=1 Tax=Bradyrhizobium sp. CCBAU 45384 TaxID=858428 RepID=UPI0023053834|nr:hypothetical protein [Bradyrhizobium sp. CCBAU 45384]MDA9408151.1 hypothetical protein [Bradyrhizobium sp. CCBAU 45384]
MRTPRRRSPLKQTPEFVDGLSTHFELLDGRDNLVAIEHVQKIVDGPLAIPLAGLHVARQDR